MAVASARIARKGDMCDTHPNVSAVMRVVDDEAHADMPALCCQPCYDRLKLELDKKRQRPCVCEWCKQTKDTVKPFKDRESSREGKTELVCADCRKSYIDKETSRDKRLDTRKVNKDEELVAEEPDYQPEPDDDAEED